MCPQVPDELDFVFLDADHSEDGTYVALSTYAPKVKAGGWIFLHDLGAGSKYDGPELAAKDYFGETFTFGEYCDDHTWAYHVIGGVSWGA
jgi:cephalosporin hydroxylase